MCSPDGELELPENPSVATESDRLLKLLQSSFQSYDIVLPGFPRASSPDSTYRSARSRASSVASSFAGSVSSGVSHPPRSGSRQKRKVNITWEEFTSQTHHSVANEDESVPIDLASWLSDLDNSTASTRAKLSLREIHNVSVPSGADISEKSHEKKKWNSSEDEEDSWGSARSRRRGTYNHRRPRLACPFYQFDPVRYHRCYNYALDHNRIVIQHLFRSHTQPKHCELCLERFPDYDSLRDHRQDLQCEKREYIAPDGITPQQKRKLQSRSSKIGEKAEDDEWFEIYEIVFPGAQKPTSAYIDYRGLWYYAKSFQQLSSGTLKAESFSLGE
ncbi:hypothetical protein FDECE_16045 [Fusarium decemcellulare]|nr:hypothetical protein FDECE_16045 [Fusarium decemcellulare]